MQCMISKHKITLLLDMLEESLTFGMKKITMLKLDTFCVIRQTFPEMDRSMDI